MEGGSPVIGSRLVFNGKAGNGTYLTMPSNCEGPQVATLHVDSHSEPGVIVSNSAETPFEGAECDEVPFKPTIDVNPQGGAVDSP